MLLLQLNFVGVTVDLCRPYVHFPATQHMFAPVAIGQFRSPTQVYELYNGGGVPVNYQLDLSPLSGVKQVRKLYSASVAAQNTFIHRHVAIFWTQKAGPKKPL